MPEVITSKTDTFSMLEAKKEEGFQNFLDLFKREGAEIVDPLEIRKMRIAFNAGVHMTINMYHSILVAPNREMNSITPSHQAAAFRPLDP